MSNDNVLSVEDVGTMLKILKIQESVTGSNIWNYYRVDGAQSKREKDSGKRTLMG